MLQKQAKVSLSWWKREKLNGVSNYSRHFKMLSNAIEESPHLFIVCSSLTLFCESSCLNIILFHFLNICRESRLSPIIPSPLLPYYLITWHKRLFVYSALKRLKKPKKEEVRDTCDDVEVVVAKQTLLSLTSPRNEEDCWKIEILPLDSLQAAYGKQSVTIIAKSLFSSHEWRG